jgi:hypothetical protein
VVPVARDGRLGAFLDWPGDLFEAEDDDGPEFDLEHLEQRRFRYVEVLDVDEQLGVELRCNLCARLFDDVDKTFEHVAEHDDQVGEAIDPFDTRLPVGGIEKTQEAESPEVPR